VSEWSDEVEAYGYCQCNGDYWGFYCQNPLAGYYSWDSSEFQACEQQEQIPMGEGVYVIVECNDPTGNSPCVQGVCETCAHPELDPGSGCREYKAKGPNGIRSALQLSVVAGDTGTCTANDREEVAARNDIREACWRWHVASESGTCPGTGPGTEGYYRSCNTDGVGQGVRLCATAGHEELSVSWSIVNATCYTPGSPASCSHIYNYTTVARQ